MMRDLQEGDVIKGFAAIGNLPDEGEYLSNVVTYGKRGEHLRKWEALGKIKEHAKKYYISEKDIIHVEVIVGKRVKKVGK